MILLVKLDDAFFDAFSKLLPFPLERVLSARFNMIDFVWRSLLALFSQIFRSILVVASNKC